VSGRSRPARLAVVLLVLAFTAAAARATTFVPMRIDDLARSSIASIIGTVQEVRSVQARDDTLYTLVTIVVEQVLRGTLPAGVIVLKEDGGHVGGRQEVELGAPRFAAGQRALLFLTARPDGSLRTNHLALGKFDITLDRHGMPGARQHFESGTTVLVPGGVTAPTSLPLGDILASIASAPSTRAAPAAVLAAPPEADDPALGSEVSEAFTLRGGRFFEPDEGTTLPFVLDQSGDALLGFAGSLQAIDGALAAWSGVAAATLRLADAGVTSDVTAPCPGPNVIIFNDPLNAIPAPQSCTGTLALGSYCNSTFESKRFGSRSFDRILRGKVILANGWEGCDLWNACNVGEIATHELGHAIGLGHSSEKPFEADALLRDATMYYLAHFDGRCAGIHADDSNAVTALYPEAIPPVILTPDPLPPAKAGMPYEQMLDATGGTGAFTWSLAGGGFPGLTLSPGGEISGVPAYGGGGHFQVTATDAIGNSHTKVLDISVAGPTATPTPTPTRTATPTATPSVTTTPTPTPTPADTPSPSATVTASNTPSASQTPSPTPTDAPTATPTAPPTPSPTTTPTDTPTPLPSSTPTQPPTPTATVSAPCVGDCDGSGEVSIDELLSLVNIALGTTSLAACPAGDRDHDSTVTVDEILVAVDAALTGCIPASATR
jgi:hypothetical protein